MPAQHARTRKYAMVVLDQSDAAHYGACGNAKHSSNGSCSEPRVQKHVIYICQINADIVSFVAVSCLGDIPYVTVSTVCERKPCY
jgi:hypothetical protein